jgi:hypothetical protein
MDDTVRILACQECGHLFNGNTGKIIPDLQDVVIENSDREHTKCLPCVMLQNVKDEDRHKWPSR